MHKETRTVVGADVWKEDENGTEMWKGSVSLIRKQLGCLHCIRAILAFMSSIPAKSSVPDPQGPLVIPESADITYKAFIERLTSVFIEFM